MTQGIKILHEFGRESSLLRFLGGSLDEHFSPQIVFAPEYQTLVLDLDQITHVSSFGVREWVRNLTSARKQFENLYFVRASTRMTDQFNMVVGVDAGGTLLSFRATYVCRVCGEETATLFDVQLDRELFEKLDAPVRQCRVCGQDAELDDDPSVLFEYVRSSEFAPPPPAVLSLLRDDESGLSEVPGVRLTTRQAIVGEETHFSLAGTLDKSLPLRRIAECGASRVFISLRDVVHVTPEGLGRWRELIQRTTGRTQMVLRQAPPVFLRWASADSTVLGDTNVETVALPLQGRQLHQTNWQEFPVSVLRAANVQVPEGTKLLISGRELTKFASVLERPTAGTGPQVVRTAPPKVSQGAGSSSAAVQRTAAPPFEERFTILAKVGEGGMAEVYLVRQSGEVGFRRLAIVKKMKPDYLTDDRIVRLFLEEARMAARLDHHNIVRVHDLGRTQGHYFMVMEYTHGRTIAEIVHALRRRGEGAPFAVACEIARQMCVGLAKAHTIGGGATPLVHRDLTPNNVMMTFDGTVKILDFGLAGHKHLKKDLNRQGHILGSAPYVPPEIYQGQDAVPQSDLWDVGLLLYLLVSTEHPFYQPDTQEMAKHIVKGRLKKPKRKLPRALWSIIKQALEKKPHKRFGSTAVMEQQLRNYLAKDEEGLPLGEWLSELFPQQRVLEQQFMQRAGVASIEDAFLTASPAEVDSFFSQLHTVEFTAGTPY